MKSLVFNLINAFSTVSCIVLKLPVSKLEAGPYITRMFYFFYLSIVCYILTKFAFTLV